MIQFAKNNTPTEYCTDLRISFSFSYQFLQNGLKIIFFSDMTIIFKIVELGWGEV
jgi:hypothetical protein